MKMRINKSIYYIGVVNYFLFFLALDAFAHIEKIYSLEGTFGDREVIVEIVDNEGHYNARYCFRDEKSDIFLQGEYDTLGFKLYSKKYYTETKQQDVIELIEIVEDSVYNWSGSWKAPDGQVYEVLLHPIVRDTTTKHAINGQKLRNSISLYEYSRLCDIKYKPAGRQKFKGGIKVVWIQETESGVVGLRFEKGLPDSTMQKMNNLMEEMHVSDIVSNFDCGSMAFKGSYVQKLEITFLTQEVLSLVKSVYNDCFNRGMQEQKEYLTIDIKSNKKMKIDDLLWMGDSIKPRYGSKEYLDYRRGIFGKEITEYINGKYIDEIQQPVCDYTNEKVFQFPNFYLTDKGMMLIVDHFSLSNECKNPNWTLLPYSDFVNYWNREYIKLK